MSTKRKNFSNEFKKKVVLESLTGFKTLTEIAREYEVHPNCIGQWKKQALENFSILFENTPKLQSQSEDKKEIEILYGKIGKLQMELEWLKKKFS